MAKTNPELLINEIQDIYLRRNFLSLEGYFKSQNQLLDFKFLSVKFTDGNLTQKISHGLKFVPLDVILLSITNNASVAFRIGLFDSKNVEISVDKPCSLRFFTGRYFNDNNDFQPNKTDKIVFGPNVGVFA